MYCFDLLFEVEYFLLWSSTHSSRFVEHPQKQSNHLVMVAQFGGHTKYAFLENGADQDALYTVYLWLRCGMVGMSWAGEGVEWLVCIGLVLLAVLLVFPLGHPRLAQGLEGGHSHIH